MENESINPSLCLPKLMIRKESLLPPSAEKYPSPSETESEARGARSERDGIECRDFFTVHLLLNSFS
jgi:hypothetical protein